MLVVLVGGFYKLLMKRKRNFLISKRDAVEEGRTLQDRPVAIKVTDLSTMLRQQMAAHGQSLLDEVAELEQLRQKITLCYSNLEF